MLKKLANSHWTIVYAVAPLLICGGIYGFVHIIIKSLIARAIGL